MAAYYNFLRWKKIESNSILIIYSREAAEHLLTALNQQAAGKGPLGKTSGASMSDGIWSTLRLVLSLMDRQDLFTAIDRR